MQSNSTEYQNALDDLDGIGDPQLESTPIDIAVGTLLSSLDDPDSWLTESYSEHDNFNRIKALMIDGLCDESGKNDTEIGKLLREGTISYMRNTISEDYAELKAQSEPDECDHADYLIRRRKEEAMWSQP